LQYLLYYFQNQRAPAFAHATALAVGITAKHYSVRLTVAVYII
jgi:hypothetical protein